MRRLLLVLCVAAALTGCTREANTGKTDVVVGFYPLAFLAERIGGPDVAITDLTPPGVEPHDIDLTVRQVVAVHDSDEFVYLHGLAPAVDEASTEARRRLDLSQVAHLVTRDGQLDPHAWLDPVRMLDLATAVGEALAKADPAHADGYRARTQALAADLRQLDGDYRAGLAHCARQDVVTSHEAFGYLSERYGLRQVAVTGLVPDAEPRPGQLARVVRYSRAHDVSTIYFESAVSPKIARIVAHSVHAQVAVLDPLETKPEGTDYLGAMRRNLAALRAGLDCT